MFLLTNPGNSGRRLISRGLVSVKQGIFSTSLTVFLKNTAVSTGYFVLGSGPMAWGVIFINASEGESLFNEKSPPHSRIKIAVNFFGLSEKLLDISYLFLGIPVA